MRRAQNCALQEAAATGSCGRLLFLRKEEAVLQKNGVNAEESMCDVYDRDLSNKEQDTGQRGGKSLVREEDPHPGNDEGTALLKDDALPVGALSILRNNKRVSLQAILRHASLLSTTADVQYWCIRALIDKNYLVPCVELGRHKSDARFYRYYDCYFVDSKQQQEEKNLLLQEVRQLDDRIHKEFYVRDLDRYKKDKKYLEVLDTFLKRRSYLLETTAGPRERLCQIFGDPHAMDHMGIKTMLSHCFRVSAEKELNFIVYPMPLISYCRETNVPQNALIVENLDTYSNLRRMVERGDTIIRTRFSTIIYSQGESCVNTFTGYRLTFPKYLQDTRNTFYFFGDIDYASMRLYEKIRNLLYFVDVHLFTEAYVSLINKVQDPELLPVLKKQKVDSGSCSVFFHEMHPFFREKEIRRASCRDRV